LITAALRLDGIEYLKERRERERERDVKRENGREEDAAGR
jgi:hypothetical protein